MNRFRRLYIKPRHKYRSRHERLDHPTDRKAVTNTIIIQYAGGLYLDTDRLVRSIGTYASKGGLLRRRIFTRFSGNLLAPARLRGYASRNL
jgi:hypothetical protein